MKKLAVATALVILGGAVPVRAATAVLTLVTPDATNWQLYVQASTGDNFGVYSVGATILGADTSGPGHLVNMLPTGQVAQDPGNDLGFAFQYETPEAPPLFAVPGPGLNFVIAQPPVVNYAGEFLYGVGQAAGSFSAALTATGFTPQNTNDDSFLVPVLVAQGTMPNGVTPTLYLPETKAQLFLTDTGTTSGGTPANTILVGRTALVWKGTVDNHWNLTSTNWNSPAVVFANNTDTLLDDTGANHPAIDLSVTVTPLFLTVNNSAVDYTISGSGAIDGATSLVKSGSGTLTLSTSNAYTGGTIINGGTVQFAQAAALPGAGAVSVAGGATLAINAGGTGEFSSAASGAGSLGNVVSATTWSNGSTLGIDTTHAGGSLTYNGVIAGNLGLNKLGSGALVLTATPTYTGATTVTAGTLQVRQIANNNGLTIASGAAAVLTASGGTNPNASVVNALTVNGNLDLTDNGLVITGATAATESAVAALIAGGNLTSSTVAAHPGVMTIAYDFAGNLGLTFTGGVATWGGQAISSTNASTDLLLLPTLIGDLNMDGSVNALDYFALTPNLGKSGQTWGSGDLNGDGSVNAVDYFALTPNLGQSVAGLSPSFAFSAPGNIAVTPEPASLILLGLGGLVLFRRRRVDQTDRVSIGTGAEGGRD